MEAEDATKEGGGGTPVDPRTDAASPRDLAILALKSCYDPEIPVDVYELGLIYDLKIDAEGRAEIRMTLTSPACPVAGSLPGEVQAKVAAVPGITSAHVELVWDPPWSQDMMSEEAKLRLGFL